MLLDYPLSNMPLRYPNSESHSLGRILHSEGLHLEVHTYFLLRWKRLFVSCLRRITILFSKQELKLCRNYLCDKSTTMQSIFQAFILHTRNISCVCKCSSAVLTVLVWLDSSKFVHRVLQKPTVQEGDF